MGKSSQKKIKKILVVNVNWIGDVIFSSPIFKNLKQTYPDAHIACLAVPRVKEILESVPFIDEIIVYDEKGKHWSPLGKLGLILKLWTKHFDIAFLLHRSFTRAFLVFLAGIPRRVGYDAKGRAWLLTYEVEILEGPIHRSDYYLNVIESYGIEVTDRQCVLKVYADDEKAVKRMLSSNGIRDEDFVIIVNPGGNWDLKRWPPESYVQLIVGLVKKFKAKVIISGAEKDVSLFKKINELASNAAIDMTGKTDLRQLIALMKRANLVISADSGPLHIANGIGTDVIGLFGPTRPEITGPRGRGQVHIVQYDLGCNREACYYLMCPDNVCMQSITVEDILNNVRQIKNQ